MKTWRLRRVGGVVHEAHGGVERQHGEAHAGAGPQHLQRARDVDQHRGAGLRASHTVVTNSVEVPQALGELSPSRRGQRKLHHGPHAASGA